MSHTPERRRSLRAAGSVLAISLLSPAAFGADNPGAHQHGHSQLQVAVEGDRLDLIFTSPAQNLAGFERDARTPEEEARLETIRKWLETNPLIDTASASCSVIDAVARQSGSDGDQQHQEHHHDHDDHKDEGHREYEISQQLNCQDLTAEDRFNAVVMAQFPGIEVLSVQWVSEEGQGSVRLEGSQTGFSLQR